MNRSGNEYLSTKHRNKHLIKCIRLAVMLYIRQLEGNYTCQHRSGKERSVRASDRFNEADI